MLNQVLKFALVSSALVWLKPRWRGLLALTVFVLLVHILHGEFLDYVELSGNDDYLLVSFLIKWTCLVLGLVAYYLFAIAGLRLRGRAVQQPSAASDSVPVATISKVSTDDGFDFLRHKKALQGEAEKLLDERGD